MHIDPTLMSVSGCALAGVVVWAADEEPAVAESENEPAEPKPGPSEGPAGSTAAGTRGGPAR